MSTAAALAIDDLPSVDLLTRSLATLAWSRAYRWSQGELDLHEAVDWLQAWAERWDLVAALGQDRVQATMSEAFRRVRDDL